MNPQRAAFAAQKRLALDDNHRQNCRLLTSQPLRWEPDMICETPHHETVARAAAASTVRKRISF
jgi:hypothetical protein